MKLKKSKNKMRKVAYKPQKKTVDRFTSRFRKACVDEGLTVDAFDQSEMWNRMEKKLGEMLLEFIYKSPIF